MMPQQPRPARAPVVETGDGSSPIVVVADDGDHPIVLILLTRSPHLGQRFTYAGRRWELIADRGMHRGFIAQPAG